MLMDAFVKNDPVSRFVIEPMKKMFNQRGLNAVSNDDCALNSSTEQEMQQSIEKFSAACRNFSLTISKKKTVFMHQPASGKPYTKPSISVAGEELKTVDIFTYMGSMLSSVAKVDDEVNCRLAKASSAFGRLFHTV
jgi:hypothetical protein